MAIIKSGASTDQLTVDPISKAARVTLYDTDGNPASGSTVTVTNFPATQPISGTIIAKPISASLAVTQTGASGTAVTITLPAISGQFHYITFIEIVRYAAAAITGNATPVIVTTTNLPGNIAYTFDTAGAVGTAIVRTTVLNQPMKSSVLNTATTIVCPATNNVIWRVNVYYYGDT